MVDTERDGGFQDGRSPQQREEMNTTVLYLERMNKDLMLVCLILGKQRKVHITFNVHHHTLTP